MIITRNYKVNITLLRKKHLTCGVHYMPFSVRIPDLAGPCIWDINGNKTWEENSGRFRTVCVCAMHTQNLDASAGSINGAIVVLISILSVYLARFFFCDVTMSPHIDWIPRVTFFVHYVARGD